jgi:hypothetical protein
LVARRFYHAAIRARHAGPNGGQDRRAKHVAGRPAPCRVRFSVLRHVPVWLHCWSRLASGPLRLRLSALAGLSWMGLGGAAAIARLLSGGACSWLSACVAVAECDTRAAVENSASLAPGRIMGHVLLSPLPTFRLLRHPSSGSRNSRAHLSTLQQIVSAQVTAMTLI